jgi:hypothetical protein
MKSAEARLQATGMFHIHGHAQERLDVGVVRHGFERIPEKDEEVDVAVHDLRPDLLIAAQRPALQPFNLKA